MSSAKTALKAHQRMGLSADLEAVEGVSPLAEAGAGLGILAGVHDVVPEAHREALLRFDQRKHLHSHVCLVQRYGARNDQLPGRIWMRAFRFSERDMQT
jgi:hypothetical protein